MPSAVGSKFYDFVPYNYGPFDKAIYSDAEALEAEGLVFIDRESMSTPRYVITGEGAKRARELSRNAEKKATKYLEEIVDWCRSRSFPELVRAIYKAFPEYKRNSVFQG